MKSQLSFIKEGKSTLKELFKRLKNRNFSGNTGIALKNSFYNFSTSFISKIGAIIFTLLIARLLMPELFGLYTLALSTILIFASLADLGTSQTMIRFVSRALGKKNYKRAKEYLIYLSKIKFILISLSIFLLIFLAKIISHNYYQKPAIFLALTWGALYLLFLQIVEFLKIIFQSSNNFKGIFYNEIFFQILKIVIIPLLILFSIKSGFETEKIILFILLGFSLIYFFSFLFLFLFFKKSTPYLSEKAEKIPKQEKKKVNKFFIITSANVFSGVFFGYIDILILGRFVPSEFIGYYSAAFNFIGALFPLLSFSVALLPLFSRLSTKSLRTGLKKSIAIVSALSLLAFLFLFIFSPIIIKIIFGSSFSPSANILRALSLLLIPLPLISLYSNYFFVKNKPFVITKFLFISTIMNIVLNYIFILWFIKYGYLAAVYGVILATLISKYFYLFALILKSKNLKA